MALSHAIMVSLLDRPQTGYELSQRFEKTVGFFWKASFQQIYQQLHKMAKAGWVSGETVAQTDRPNRIVYTLTDCGREVLDEWVATPTDPPSVKEELLVKLFALGDADTDTLYEELQRRKAFHQDRLAWYEAVMAEHYPDPAQLTARQKGRYLGLRMGILSEQTSLDWCAEAVQLVNGLRESEKT
ncbi:MAG: PadR family transcriptional regulator [Nevskiales bacterium]